jgi:hypothetical protein
MALNYQLVTEFFGESMKNCSLQWNLARILLGICADPSTKSCIMKSTLLASAILLSISLQAQLKTSAVCPNMVVDILEGKVDGLPPNATAGQVETMFPCFTGSEESSASCGAVVYYRDKNISFFTGRNYVEIKEGFKGRLTVPLMGAPRTGLFKWLGLPKIKDVKWDAFQTQYGTLILYYSAANKVNKIQFTNLSTEQIKLCQ